jgi:hypothetical protein
METASASKNTSCRPAPVAVFAFNRPAHLRQTIESLHRNAEAPLTQLVVFCDGARSRSDEPATEAVRDYARSIKGFASVTVHEQGRNLGLARSIIQGVSQMLEQHDRVIVLEDDLFLSPHFLAYMNDALAIYADDARVASVHGYCYPVGVPLPETFFLRGADCWGWATWRRAWPAFRADGRALLAELEARNLTRAFDLDGAFPFTQMLRDQVAGRNDSWAVRWHASCFLQDLLTLYPGRSLVENTGNDASGTHCGTSDAYAQSVAQDPVRVDRIATVPCETARRAFAQFLRKTRRREAIRAIGRVFTRLGGRA